MTDHSLTQLRNKHHYAPPGGTILPIKQKAFHTVTNKQRPITWVYCAGGVRSARTTSSPLRAKGTE
ncbi:MAG: hypothetical protein V2I38_09755, partial [Alcanivoracaceae bacterium]|nr:hypothetical protein [Alcanivoracaceae bacterium]